MIAPGSDQLRRQKSWNERHLNVVKCCLQSQGLTQTASRLVQSSWLACTNISSTLWHTRSPQMLSGAV